ncbi:MAG: response regulator [Caulobacteraceae bacterium]|nr:response regulator [Caulobacteraceae bacterium]
MARILLVDDEAMLRRTLRAMLERAGHAVIEAEDGAQALRIFARESPDLVITDIVMPNVEGVETIQELRRRDPDLPIIAMSGGGSKGGALFLTIAKEIGATRTLAKPIRQAELMEALAASLRKA